MVAEELMRLLHAIGGAVGARGVLHLVQGSHTLPQPLTHLGEHWSQPQPTVRLISMRFPPLLGIADVMLPHQPNGLGGGTGVGEW